MIYEKSTHALICLLYYILLAVSLIIYTLIVKQAEVVNVFGLLDLDLGKLFYNLYLGQLKYWLS